MSKKQIKRITEEIERQSQNEISMFRIKIKQLENENITLKEEYSDALQEINTLLFKYQTLEQTNKRNQLRQERHSTTRAENIQHECERLRLCLQREENEVKRLNQILSASKVRPSHGNNQQKINKITQPLWLGEERLSVARFPDSSKGHSRQKFYQL